MAVDTPWTFETRRVRTDRGEFRAATLGSGPDLLVLHTLRNQLEYAYLVAPRLAERFTVHVIDLPGHGESSRDLSLPFDAERFFGDVHAFVDAEGLREVTVVGESIGATTALVLAARAPERIRAVYAFNPHDRTPMLGGRQGAALARLGRYTAIPWRLERPSILRSVLAAAFADPSHLPEEYLRLLAESGRHPAYPAIMKSVMANQGTWPAAREHYAQISSDLPVTLAYGDRDWADEPHRARNAEMIPGVSGYVSMVATGHWSFLDRPDRVLEIVLGSS